MPVRFSLRPGRRTARLVTLLAVVGSITGASAVVWSASYSALSATTSNGSNTWSAGNVALANDSSGTAMFTATNLKPGSTGTKCIAVTSSGSLASTVKLYGASYSTTNGLGTQLNLAVTQGTGGSFGGGCGSFVADGSNSNVFTGTLDSFGTSATSFATGNGIWAPASGTVTKVYQFVYTVNASAPNTIQGGTAAITFTWEAQNS